jgi:hypothetical protein
MWQRITPPIFKHDKKVHVQDCLPEILLVLQRLTPIFYIFLFIAFLQSTQDIKRVISKRDGCVYLKQVPSIDGSLEFFWWDPLATFCWVFFLFQVDWTGLLVGCCFVLSDFCDSSRIFLERLIQSVLKRFSATCDTTSDSSNLYFLQLFCCFPVTPRYSHVGGFQTFGVTCCFELQSRRGH